MISVATHPIDEATHEYQSHMRLIIIIHTRSWNHFSAYTEYTNTNGAIVATRSIYPLYVNKSDTTGIIADIINIGLFFGYLKRKKFLTSINKYKKAAV